METFLPPESRRKPRGIGKETYRVQFQYCSPGMLLANFLSQEEQTNSLVLVTGKRGAGKTSWCLELSRLARLWRLQPVGLLSPPVFQDGRKVSIDLLNIATGERRRLAERRNGDRADERPAMQTANWHFDIEVLSWGNRILEQIHDSELLILDELGPLELLDEKGLMAGTKAVDARRYRLGCIVVRPSLLQAACERWSWGEVMYLGERE